MNASTTRDGIEVQPGQTWRDRDKRMHGRTVTIVGVQGGLAFYDRGQHRKPGRLSIARLHNKSTGFDLIDPKTQPPPQP